MRKKKQWNLITKKVQGWVNQNYLKRVHDLSDVRLHNFVNLMIVSSLFVYLLVKQFLEITCCRDYRLHNVSSVG
jgi:hypothetical protein